MTPQEKRDTVFYMRKAGLNWAVIAEELNLKVKDVIKIFDSLATKELYGKNGGF